MTTIISTKLTYKTTSYPDGIINLVVSKVDADWIQTLRIQAGSNGHPSVVPSRDITMPGTSMSLARLVLQKHGIPVDDNSWVCRTDTSKPWDVSHENLCVPIAIIQHHLNISMNGARTITLKDYLNLFCITRPAEPEQDPIYVNVLDMDTAKQTLLICDAEDAEWLEGMPVRFNTKGFPMIQKDWGKWTPLMFEQARRAGAHTFDESVVFHIKLKEPRDVRKYFIAIMHKDRTSTLA